MIDVKQAVNAAESYARALFPDTELRHLRLEEVELTDDERRWRVTLGWAEPALAPHTIVLGNGLQKLPRVYKLFEVDADSGRVRSMKIRDVE